VSLTKTEYAQDCYPIVESAVKTFPKKLYSGTFSPLFSNRSYTFDSGKLEKIVESLDSDKYAHHDDNTNTLCVSYYAMCESVNKQNDEIFKIGYSLLNDENLENPFSPFQNIVFALTDINSTERSLKIMLIHYIRDFCTPTLEKCVFCTNDKYSLVDHCIKCTALIASFDSLTKNINYDIFN
jgi:hypothetical protein